MRTIVTAAMALPIVACLLKVLMEGFFGILKREMFYGFEKHFKNLNELEDAIRDYIEYYNHRRIKIKLKGLTPLEYWQLVLS